MAAAGVSAPGAFAPLGHRAFAFLWAATLVSNAGTWMNDVGAGWLMTTLAPSPLMVAAVQAATMAPMFLFALPAGALADILDRRRLLIAVNLAMAVVAACFAALVAADAATAPLLLAATFLLGTGAALSAPAWQAVVPTLVPRAEMPAAVALNSLGVNVSRAVGPALAGVLIAAAGLAAPFVANAASFLAIIAALAFWKQAPAAPSAAPPERMGLAVRAGLRYARHSGPLRATLGRAALFFLPASCFWAMAPLVARDMLSGGPALYGLLMGAVGAGAVACALVMPRLKAWLGVEGLARAASLGYAAALAAPALAGDGLVAIAAALVAGACWLATVSTLNVSAQTALPDWVRARGLSIHLTVFYGAMTIGSLLWGQVAALLGVPGALLAAAGAIAAGLPLAARLRLNAAEGQDLAPSMHWPAPVACPGEPDRGPVLVTIDYDVDPARRDDFLALVRGLGETRRRDGALDWSVAEDAAAPGVHVEWFVDPSWADHLRRHARVTGADRTLQEAIRATLRPGAAPRIRHLVGVAQAG